MSRHDALKAEWQHGQYFETLVEGCNQWVAVGNGGLAPPLWDEGQSYRRRPDLELKDCDDREACRLWIEAGMPQYLLSKPGTNHGLVRFLALARAATPATERPVCTYTTGCDCDVPRPLPQGNKAWHCPKQQEHAAKVWKSISVDESGQEKTR